MTRSPEELEATNTESRLKKLDESVLEAYKLLRDDPDVVNLSDTYKTRVRATFEVGRANLQLERYGAWFEDREDWYDNPRFYFLAAEFYLTERNLLKDGVLVE